MIYLLLYIDCIPGIQKYQQFVSLWKYGSSLDKMGEKKFKIQAFKQACMQNVIYWLTEL